MKIIYCTDIHDGLWDLRVLLKESTADLYLLSGDIIYKAFYDEDKIYQFVSLQEEFYTLIAEFGSPFFPFDFAGDILRFPEKYNRSKELQEKATLYRALFDKAAKTMKEKYQVIEGVIERYANAECFMLPGNYDIDLRYTALAQRNIHHKSVEFRDIVISGYGGAPIVTSGIPEKLAVKFHERVEGGRLYSEPEEFFDETIPDIVAIHNPAYGFFDRIPSVGRCGSQGIRQYLDEAAPTLVVSGHVHEDYGVSSRKNGTVLLNPSNFGGVDSVAGYQAGGTFAEIYVENKKVEKVNLMRILDDKIHCLMECEINGTEIIAKKMPNADELSPLDLNIFVRDGAGIPVNQ